MTEILAKEWKFYCLSARHCTCCQRQLASFSQAGNSSRKGTAEGGIKRVKEPRVTLGEILSEFSQE